MSAAPTLYQQTVGVLKKNVALKLADRKKLTAEIGYPVYFALILFMVLLPLRNNLDFKFAGACSGQVDVDENAICESTPKPLAPADSCDAPTTPLSLLLYSPDDAHHQRIMNDTLELLNSSLSCTKGFATREAAEAWYLSNGPATNTTLQGGFLSAVAGAVFFEPASNAENRSFMISFPQVNIQWCSVAGRACPRWGDEDVPLSEDDGLLERRFEGVQSDFDGTRPIVWTTSLSLQWAVTRALAMSESAALREAIEQARANDRVPTPPLLAKLPLPPLQSALNPTLPELAINIPIYLATM